MDWPTAAVLISAIASALLAYLASLWAPGQVDTEAIGFHVGHIGGKDGSEDEDTDRT